MTNVFSSCTLIRLVCSDWKFLAILLGLSGAKAKYFCIWCKSSKEQILYFLSKFDDLCISNLKFYINLPKLLQ